MAAMKMHFIASSTEAAVTAAERLSERYGHVPLREAEVIVALGGDGLMLSVMHQNRGLPVAHASTLAVNCMVAVEIAYLFNTRTGIRSALGLTALRATRPTWVAIGVLLLLQLAFTYWQPLQRLFTTQALDGGDWLMVGLSAVLTFLIVEADKAWCRRRG